MTMLVALCLGGLSAHGAENERRDPGIIVRDSEIKTEPAPDAAVAASKELYSKGLDKSLEFEADRKGAVVAARAGYDPYGLVHFLMTLDGAGADPEFLGFFLSTHPATGDRLDALNAVLEANVDDTEGAAPRENLARVQARLLTLSAAASTPYQEADRPPEEKTIDESERSGGIRR